MKNRNNWALLILFIFLSLSAIGQGSFHMDLVGQKHRGDQRYSGSWIYTNDAGTEYALLGAYSGLAVYDMADPTLTELGFVPGPGSNWREITVIEDHAYITTEGGGGSASLQVVDLSNLPNGIQLVASYNTTFTTGHILQRNVYNNEPFIYVSGTSTTQGVHILDVSNPLDPIEIGVYDPGYYIHDCHIKGDYMYACAFYEATLDIVDISDKTNPVLITQIPNQTNAHSCWMHEDDVHLFVCYEQDGLLAHIYDVSNLNDIELINTYTANSASLVHNPYIRGNTCFVSHNTEGIRTIDISDPTNLVENGYYDTYTGPSGGFSGLWSACPFSPSGKIIGGNREDGLYIWEYELLQQTPTTVRVFDINTNLPIQGAASDFFPTDLQLIADANGTTDFNFVSGHYNHSTSAAGYLTENGSVVIEGTANQTVDIYLTPDLTNVPNATRNQIKVGPNPVADQFNIHYPENLPDVDLLLYNEAGKLVASFPSTIWKNQAISLADLPKGMYVVSLAENASLWNTTLIKF